MNEAKENNMEEEKEDKAVEMDAAQEQPADSGEQSADAQPTEGAEAPADEKSPAEEGEKVAEESKPEVIDWKDRCARTLADFDNFRKRTAREREDLVKFAASDVIKDILPTVDNLALALEKAKDKTDDPFIEGVKLVYDGIIKALAAHGAEPIDSVGEPFDANFHEALAQMPSPDVEEGVIMNEVKRGWLLHGKLLRAAQVVVSAGKQA